MSSKVLHLYRQERDRCLKTFPCPKCHDVITSTQFENQHAKTCFSLNQKLQCVWCLGKTAWKSRHKFKNINHLKKCWTTCSFRKPPPSTPRPRPTSDPRAPRSRPTSRHPIFLFDDDALDSPLTAAASSDFFFDPTLHQPFVLHNPHELLCPERDFFGHSPLPDLPPDLYDHLPFPPLELDPIPDLFENSNLNLAAACVLRYFELQDTHAFFHCTVRGVAILQLLALLEDNDRVRVLPFACWCNGGSFREARHRQHWHLLFVYPLPVDRFQQEVWVHIQIPPEDKPREADGKLVPNFHAFYKKSIQGPMHLVNALGYVSRRESRCKGTLEEDEGHPESGGDLNHYAIYNSLPTLFRKWLVLLWNGGLLQLIHQHYQHRPPIDLVQADYDLYGGVFRFKIQDLPGIPLHEVVPVAKHLRPTACPTADSVALHLMKGEKLHFKRDDSLLALDSDAWGQVQADAGNLLYAAVGEHLWTPCTYQQKCLNAIRFFKFEMDDLRATLQAERTDSAAEMERLSKAHALAIETIQTLTLEKDALREALVEKDANHKI